MVIAIIGWTAVQEPKTEMQVFTRDLIEPHCVGVISCGSGSAGSKTRTQVITQFTADTCAEAMVSALINFSSNQNLDEGKTYA